MKPPFLVTSFLCCILLGGCKDISDVRSSYVDNGEFYTEENERKPLPPFPNTPIQTPETKYPFNRKLVDSEGRSIEVRILAKAGNEIAFRRVDIRREYIIPTSRLSEADQKFLNELTDGGDFKAASRKIKNRKQLAGRKAIWHRQMVNAKNESSTLDLPILLSVLINDNDRSREVQNKVLFSKEFRKWANENICLCLLEVDAPQSNKTTSSSAKIDREEAARFGITAYRGPTMMVTKGEEKYILSDDEMSDFKSAIVAIEDSFDNRNQWTRISPSSVPGKVRPIRSTGSS